MMLVALLSPLYSGYVYIILSTLLIHRSFHVKLKLGSPDLAVRLPKQLSESKEKAP
jgi:hypothetical protein